MSIDSESIRLFFRRLSHRGYGVTVLAVIDTNGSGVIATGFFDNEDDFVKACEAYNGRYNIYASRYPRPRWLPMVCENCMDTRYRQRARDNDIGYITAISLDIDPIRSKGTSSDEKEHQEAINFALNIQKDMGGSVDDSGNGAYLWFSFAEPIKSTDDNRDIIKQKCQQWQKLIVERYQPEKHGLKIDGCLTSQG